MARAEQPTAGPYAGHDPKNTRRFAGLIWLLFGAVALAILPVGAGKDAGADQLVAAVALSGWSLPVGVALLRNWGVGYGTMLAFSYVGVVSLIGLQLMAGERSDHYDELFLTVALHTASVHPPRRLLPLLGFLAGATFLGAADEWNGEMLVGTVVHLAIWSLVCVMASQLVKELREQRSSARSGEAAAHDLARTDALTELGNRRGLLRDLEAVLETADESDPAVLVLLDLDGFKSYNDTFGHPAGDELLRRLGGALQARLDGRATAYRMGGDEFCVLGRTAGGDVGALVASAVEALSEHGDGFSVRASHGAILIPEEAATAQDALGLADRRMYACKGASRGSAGRQTTDVLLKLLGERDPELGDHVRDVAHTCEGVARRVGLPEEEIPALLQAATLHDIGKTAIPDAILDKPGPLDDAEWAFMKRHTVIGERILMAAPSLRAAARHVRSSHERFDGGGYPDGLAGTDIPLGARIIAVCDAYEAMTADRAYRRAMSPELALEELRRCAGTQFDPRVVEALCAVAATASPRRAPGTRA